MLKCKKKQKKKCLLDVIKCGIEKDIASDLRKDCLEQNLDHKVINSPFWEVSSMSDKIFEQFYDIL